MCTGGTPAALSGDPRRLTRLRQRAQARAVARAWLPNGLAGSGRGGMASGGVCSGGGRGLHQGRGGVLLVVVSRNDSELFGRGCVLRCLIAS